MKLEWSFTYSTAIPELVFTHPVLQHPENRSSLDTVGLFSLHIVFCCLVNCHYHVSNVMHLVFF